jgi:hypothetical protein
LTAIKLLKPLQYVISAAVLLETVQYSRDAVAFFLKNLPHGGAFFTALGAVISSFYILGVIS